jgi:hypothetical protein
MVSLREVDPMKIGNYGVVVIRSELAKIATSIDKLGNTDRELVPHSTV